MPEAPVGGQHSATVTCHSNYTDVADCTFV